MNGCMRPDRCFKYGRLTSPFFLRTLTQLRGLRAGEGSSVSNHPPTNEKRISRHADLPLPKTSP
jgi:hypothetical protein